jgi:hypothetical protein
MIVRIMKRPFFSSKKSTQIPFGQMKQLQARFTNIIAPQRYLLPPNDRVFNLALTYGVGKAYESSKPSGGSIGEEMDKVGYKVKRACRIVYATFVFLWSGQWLDWFTLLASGEYHEIGHGLKKACGIAAPGF